MTSLLSQPQDQFQERLIQEFGNFPQTGQDFKLKAKFWDHFLELGLPSKRSEVYAYVKLRKLFGLPLDAKRIVPSDELKEIAGNLITRDAGLKLVFCNGYYYPELSTPFASPKVTVIPLERAALEFAAFFNNHLVKSLKSETDPFAALNGALYQGGLFLYIPPNVMLKEPIEIIHLIDVTGDSKIMNPRIQVFGGANSEFEISIINRTVSGETFFSNQLIDFVLGDGARAKLYQITMGASPTSWIFDAVRATLKRDSYFRSVSVTDGAGTVRSDYAVQLTGENGEASLNGLWMLKGAKEAHTNVNIEHIAPHTRSQQLFKGVLNDQSASSFEGKIFVRQAAQKTDAFQLNNNLLLNDKARASAKPNLEIFADDVKASHGATFGQLNAEHLFYLFARGFSKEAAKNLLVEGYCQEVVDLISQSVLREEVRSKIWDSLF